MCDNDRKNNRPYQFFLPFNCFIPLKQLLTELDKNAMNAWKAIEEDEIKLENFFDIVCSYRENIITKQYCSDFDDNETIRKEMDKEKFKLKKYEEKMKHYNDLIKERKTLETIVEVEILPERINKVKKRINDINKETESIERYVEKNRPVAYILDARQRSKAVDTPYEMIKIIRKMIESTEQFIESIQNTNEKLAYLFKNFHKIKMIIPYYNYIFPKTFTLHHFASQLLKL